MYYIIIIKKQLAKHIHYLYNIIKHHQKKKNISRVANSSNTHILMKLNSTSSVSMNELISYRMLLIKLTC